jgi:curli production assembly/transport component CsgF
MRRDSHGRLATVVGIAVLLSAGTGKASQLVYTPVNPSFGGSPLNGPYVLGLAASNNDKFTQNPATKQQTTGASAVQQFQQQITSALLSQIAFTVSQEIIGENARDSGSFNINGQLIQFNRVGGQIDISITDAASGANTQIQIPVPNF